MIGDVADFVRRLRSVLPQGWFSDSAPVTDSVLGALGYAWQFVYGLIVEVTALTRIDTSSGPFVDATSLDFFGSNLPRRAGESDASFVVRIKQELFRPRGTRFAVKTMLVDLTGNQPYLFEPARPADTGGYNIGGLGYNVGGGYGNLSLSHAFFITAYRPKGLGVAELAGYGTSGVVAYGNLNMALSPVVDNDIFSAVEKVIPLGCTAWVSID